MSCKPTPSTRQLRSRLAAEAYLDHALAGHLLKDQAAPYKESLYIVLHKVYGFEPEALNPKSYKP